MKTKASNAALDGLPQGVGAKHVVSEAAIVGDVHHRRDQNSEVGLTGCPRGRLDEADYRRVRDEAVLSLGQFEIEPDSTIGLQQRLLPHFTAYEGRHTRQDAVGDDRDLSHACNTPEIRQPWRKMSGFVLRILFSAVKRVSSTSRDLNVLRPMGGVRL
ncbi:hypothetical protein D9M72_360450 [compost metagenome]